MKIIKDLEKAKIDKIIAGGSNGSIVLIDLIKEDNKFVLYIYCSWRISLNDKILTGWNDSDKIFVNELMKLQNDVVNVVTTNSFGDFTLIFKSGIRLDVFSDITSNIEDSSIEENWTLCDINKNKCFNFTNKFSFSMEPFENN